MDVKHVENAVKNLNYFGGIFFVKHLKYIKIISYPVAFIFYDKKHYISVYITSKKVEVMDSSGYLNSSAFDRQFRKLLNVHIYNKKFMATPKLQSNNSNACSLYAICFLYFRTITHQSLCKFCKLFTSDFDLNCLIISDLFDTITKLKE